MVEERRGGDRICALQSRLEDHEARINKYYNAIGACVMVIDG